MKTGSAALGIALTLIAVSLIVIGRQHSDRLAQSSLVFAFYPALILVLIAFGGGLLAISITE